MCYKGKCMHCLEVETGSLIFAILNVMATSFGSLASIGGLVYTGFMTQAVMHRANEDGNEQLMAGAVIVGMGINAILAMLAVGLTISFSFGLVLLVGLCKRKAHLVKCYFVYGVVKTIFGLATVIGLTVNSNLDVAVVFLVAVIYFIYGLILLMVRLTYKKFQTEVPFNAFSNPISAIEKF